MATVLIVDDNFRIRKLLRDILGMRDFSILDAANAEEARARLGEHIPDLIFLDVMLPDTNGFELCREIRATPPVAHVPVIITTGLADREDVVKAHHAGANDYIVKPFTLITVMEKVDKFLPETAG